MSQSENKRKRQKETWREWTFLFICSKFCDRFSTFVEKHTDSLSLFLSRWRAVNFTLGRETNGPRGLLDLQVKRRFESEFRGRKLNLYKRRIFPFRPKGVKFRFRTEKNRNLSLFLSFDSQASVSRGCLRIENIQEV